METNWSVSVDLTKTAFLKRLSLLKIIFLLFLRHPQLGLAIFYQFELTFCQFCPFCQFWLPFCKFWPDLPSHLPPLRSPSVTGPSNLTRQCPLPDWPVTICPSAEFKMPPRNSQGPQLGYQQLTWNSASLPSTPSVSVLQQRLFSVFLQILK